MAVTRINNNQISDASAGNAYVGIDASTKLQPYSITSTKLANNLTYGSDFTVTGNLTVQGTTTAIDTTYTTVEDPILLLASNQTGSPTVDIGFVGQRGTSDNIAFVWDESADEFVTVYTTTGESNTTVSIASYADLHTGNANVTGNLTVSGNVTHNGTVIGNLTVSGNIASGNLLSSGLLSVTGNVNGAGATFTGNVTAQNFIGNISGNIDAGGANTQVQFNDNDLLNGTAGFTFDKTSNAATITGNVTGGNLLTAGQVSATGNVSGGNLVASSNLVSVGAVVSGNVTGGNLLTGGLISATGNITSSANIAGGNLITGSNVQAPGIVNNNVAITLDGGFPGYISFYTGGTLKVSIDDNGNIVGGNISGSGNVTGGNLLTGGLISATGNITSSANIAGANVIASANLVSVGAAVSGNVTGGNLLTAGQVSATGNITSSANIAGGNITVTGEIRSATIDTTGNVFVGGNLTVQGNIQYINVDDLRVEDPIIIMGTGPNGAPLTSPDGMDRGIYMEWYTTGLGNSWIGWQNTSGNLIAAADVVFSANNVVNVNSYGTFQAGNIYAQSAVTTGNITGGNLSAGSGIISTTGNINGGNINATTGVRAITGYFTGNVDVLGNLNASVGVVYANSGIFYGDAVTGNNAAYFGAPGYTYLGSNIVAQFTGNVDNYSQINFQNVNDGVSASTDLVLTADNGDDASYFVDLGISSSTYNYAGFPAYQPNDAYLLTNGGNLLLNTDTAGKAIKFIVGGSANSDVIATVAANGISVTGIVNASGNVTGGNLLTAGLVSATGNVTGGNLVSNGNIFATNAANVQFNDNTWFYSGYTTMNTGGIFHNTGANPDTMQVSTNSLVNGIAMWTAGAANSYVTSTGGIEFVTGATLNSFSNPTGGTSTAAITAAGITTGANVTATGNVTGANVIGTTSVTGGNIVISGDNITDTNGRVNFNTAGGDVDFAVNADTVANVFYVDAGTGTISIGSATQTTNAILAMNATNSFLMPVGNTAQRPGTGVTGMLRFNSTTNGVEVYNSSEWATVGTPSFTIISDEQFNGDGVTVAFTLSAATTTNSTIVSINGIVQIPTVAYSVGGGGSDTLTFTEAPQTGDLIDVRILTTTTQVVAISNSPGNAVVATNPTSAIVEITGDLLPTSNVTYDLGSTSARWNELWLAGSTITLGNTVIKNVPGGNTIGFFGPDGTTPAAIDAASVDTTQIASGTSNMAVISSGGNIRANVGGATVGTFYSGGLSVPGIINSGSNGVGNIGSSTGYFNTVFAKATSAQYADLAEVYSADAAYEPGTVISFGGESEVTISTTAGDARIAGVVSTNPSYVMNATLNSEYTAVVALTGRVPTKVSGPVVKGDMIVSAGNGRAMACATPAMGTVIGKALENHESGEGIIEVVVGRL